MQAEYLDRLPPQVQALVSEIERFAGRSIGVELDASIAAATEVNPDRLSVRIKSTEATILVRNDNFAPQGVLHELLHIHRYWVRRIPQIIPVKEDADNNWDVTSKIENGLEHLLIVPEEANYGFEPFAYWNETERRLFKRYPWPELTDPWSRRMNCLMGSLSVRFLVSDSDVVTLARSALDTEGLLKEAWEFAKRVHDRRHDKRGMLELVLQYVQIDRSEVKLIEFDAKAGQCYQLQF